MDILNGIIKVIIALVATIIKLSWQILLIIFLLNELGLMN